MNYLKNWMTMTCEYTRISLLFHILWKINTFTFEHICTFFPNVCLANFSLSYCVVCYNSIHQWSKFIKELKNMFGARAFLHIRRQLLINVTLAIASQIDIFTLISDLSLDKYLSVANSVIFQ